MSVVAYKLLKVRKDGSIGPLFINASARLPVGEWMEAEDHPTPGFAHRPGWHATLKRYAPHLKLRTKTQRRAWFKVLVDDYVIHDRPNNQGGKWVLAKKMKILKRFS